MLRYLLKGIGATGETGSDLLSYLAFEPEYVGRLMQLGYSDTMSRRAELEAFLETDLPELPSRAPQPVSPDLRQAAYAARPERQSD
jgi:hypothetical protein